MGDAAVQTELPSESERGPEAKRERVLSTIDFPYGSLDDAITVVKAVHKLGGNECRLDSLAAELGHDTVKSGGFRQKLSTAHTFGLTALSQGIVTLSTLGARIIDPEQERLARVEAFLRVPLYNSLYEDFKNTQLPPNQGLETKMVSLGVAAKQSDKARQAFQRSAKEAGFFAYGTTKLVYPALGAAGASFKAKDSDSHGSEPNGKPGNSGSGGGGDDGNQSLIDGLIKVLPKAGQSWPLEAQRKWLQTAAANFAYAYNGTDETRSIKVTIEND
jgi:hypothetical protein